MQVIYSRISQASTDHAARDKSCTIPRCFLFALIAFGYMVRWKVGWNSGGGGRGRRFGDLEIFGGYGVLMSGLVGMSGGLGLGGLALEEGRRGEGEKESRSGSGSGRGERGESFGILVIWGVDFRGDLEWR
jgi:hypothetical protein